MNICTKKEKTLSKTFHDGHLYKAPNTGVSIYCKYYNTFVELETGKSRTNTDYLNWENVTDKYCLQEI